MSDVSSSSRRGPSDESINNFWESRRLMKEFYRYLSGSGWAGFSVREMEYFTQEFKQCDG